MAVNYPYWILLKDCTKRHILLTPPLKLWCIQLIRSQEQEKKEKKKWMVLIEEFDHDSIAHTLTYTHIYIAGKSGKTFILERSTQQSTTVNGGIVVNKKIGKKKKNDNKDSHIPACKFVSSWLTNGIKAIIIHKNFTKYT